MSENTTQTATARQTAMAAAQATYEQTVKDAKAKVSAAAKAYTEAKKLVPADVQDKIKAASKAYTDAKKDRDKALQDATRQFAVDCLVVDHPELAEMLAAEAETDSEDEAAEGDPEDGDDENGGNEPAAVTPTPTPAKNTKGAKAA